MASIVKADVWQNTAGTAYGAVLQVKQAILTTTWSTSSNGTFVDVTNLSVTITPTSSSSKFLLLASVVYGATENANPLLRFTGGNSSNYIGDARSTRRRAAWGGGDDYFNGSGAAGSQVSFTAQMTYLDSPATTSAITYKVQGCSDSNGGFIINTDWQDPDSSGEGYTTASSLVVMEIQA
jgi:hypothetical protein